VVRLWRACCGIRGTERLARHSSLQPFALNLAAVVSPKLEVRGQVEWRQHGPDREVELDYGFAACRLSRTMELPCSGALGTPPSRRACTFKRCNWLQPATEGGRQ